MSLYETFWRHDIQQNDIQPNDIRQKSIKTGAQHNSASADCFNR